MKTNYEIRYAAHPEDAKVMIPSVSVVIFLSKKSSLLTK